MCKGIIATIALLLAGCPNADAQDQLDIDDVATRIRELLVIEDASEQRRALYATTINWAETDPITAFAAIADQPPGDWRDEIELQLLTGWLAVDTAAALRYVATLEEPPAYLMAASTMRGSVSSWLPVSADSDLLEILAIADALPAEIASSVRLQIASRLARIDPQSAADSIGTFPPEDRRQAGINIARDYASADPDAALAWGRALNEADVEQAVVAAIAARDPYGMLARALSGEEGITVTLVISGAVGSQNLDWAQFGSALAQLPGTTAREQALASFTQLWLVHDQDAALDWLADSGIELPPAAIMRAANRAGGDPGFAARFAERLNGRNRSEWIANIGSQLGREDAELALAWLEPFRADPAYSRVIASIVPQLALSNGPRAAGLLQSLEGREWLGATWTVARQWAKTDPLAAAQWADGLPDTARGPAVRAAVDEWHVHDPAGAERWVLGLPVGSLREEALLGLVSAIAREGQIPPERMFDAFGSETSRQNGILEAITMLTLRNRDGARELYETRLTDPVLRQRGEALLAGPPLEPGQRGGFFGPGPTPGSAD